MGIINEDLIKMKELKYIEEEKINKIKEFFDIMYNKTKNIPIYKATLKNIDWNNLDTPDVKNLIHFFEDWMVVSKESDGIIPLSFITTKNKKCKCEICGKENEDIIKVSNIQVPRCKTYINLCPKCTEILKPDGLHGSNTILYKHSLDYLKEYKERIPELKKNPIYKTIKTLIDDNFKLLKDTEYIDEYKSILINYSSAIFNYLILEEDLDKISDEDFLVLKEFMNTYNFMSKLNDNLDLPIFMIQAANLATSSETYLGKFKMIDLHILANEENDLYDTLKEASELTKIFNSFYKEKSIGGRYSIGRFIRNRCGRDENNYLVPNEKDMYALILTIGADSSLIEYIKYDINPRSGPYLIEYYKNYVEKLYELKYKKQDDSEFGKLIENIYKNSLSIEIPERAEKTTKRKKHKQRSAFQPS